MFAIATEGWPFILVPAVLTILAWLLHWPFLYVPGLLLTAFIAFFFRDPDRVTPHDPLHAVSPADGTVLWVEPIAHDDFIGGPATKVSVFLSVFNVHINRVPITGTVKYTAHRRWEMVSAYKKNASEVNERVTIGIEGAHARVLVHQITGLVARRIVCRVSEGDDVVQGQRYGLIKFGSCTELVVPASAEVLVKAGDKVRGAETVLARFKP